MNTMLLIIAILVSIAILIAILSLIADSKHPRINLILLGITLSIPMYFIYRNLLEIEFYKNIFIIIMTTIFFCTMVILLLFSHDLQNEALQNDLKNRKNIGGR